MIAAACLAYMSAACLIGAFLNVYIGVSEKRTGPGARATAIEAMWLYLVGLLCAALSAWVATR